MNREELRQFVKENYPELKTLKEIDEKVKQIVDSANYKEDPKVLEEAQDIAFRLQHGDKN